MALFGRRKDEAQESPWAKEEAERNRVKYFHRFTVPTASLFTARIGILLLAGLLIFREVRAWRVDNKVKNMIPMIVRVNDVGRAEVVRLDTDYIPEEPEVRYQLIALVQRMFSRNGFTLPEAIQVNGAFLVGEAFETWVKQAKEDLKNVAIGKDLRRVRILYCHIDRVAQAKTSNGTRAIVRFATDSLAENGAVIRGSAQGYEAVLDFRIGDWVKTDKQEVRDNWLSWNPLGMRLYRYQVHQYQGADVQLAAGDPGNLTTVPVQMTGGAPGPESVPDVNTAQAYTPVVSPHAPIPGQPTTTAK